jgi:hypothetical protein
MGYLRGVLKEELSNSLRMKKNFEHELSQLPKGSLIKKKIKNNYYYYLEKRDKGKIKFIYRGRPPKSEIKKYEEAKNLRAKYRHSVSVLKKQINFLERALSGQKAI